MNRTLLLLLILTGSITTRASAQSSGDLPPTPKRGLNFYYETMRWMYGLGDKGMVAFRVVVDERGFCTEIQKVHSFIESVDSLVASRLERLTFFPARSQYRPVSEEVLLAFHVESIPSYPKTLASQDHEYAKVASYFSGLPAHENTYHFYPMMPGWEKDKEKHLKASKHVPKEKEEIAFFVPPPGREPDGTETIIEMEGLEERDTPNEEKLSDDDFDWGELEEDGEALIEEVDVIPDYNDFVMVEREPAPVNIGEVKKMIGYPGFAKELGIEGKVIIRILIDKNGNVVRMINLRPAISPFLVEAVTARIGHLQFTPAIQNSRPIYCWVTIPFDFKLLR